MGRIVLKSELYTLAEHAQHPCYKHSRYDKTGKTQEEQKHLIKDAGHKLHKAICEFMPSRPIFRNGLPRTELVVLSILVQVEVPTLLLSSPPSVENSTWIGMMLGAISLDPLLASKVRAALH